MSATVEVLGLGNSLVDILAYADDDYLSAQEMVKGAMNLIDEDRAEALYAARVDPRVISGGSAANTIVGVASFGVRRLYRQGQARSARRTRSPTTSARPAWLLDPAGRARAGDRTLFHLCHARRRAHDEHLSRREFLSRAPRRRRGAVKAAKVVYLEGYMWDRPAAKTAFQKAGEIARAAGRQVALTLSDSFCVDRFRGEFIELMRSKTVDTIFANTDEILSLYETPHFDEALDACARRACSGSSPGRKKAAWLSKRADLGGARLPDRQTRRYHRRGRHVRRRLPLRLARVAT